MLSWPIFGPDFTCLNAMLIQANASNSMSILGIFILMSAQSKVACVQLGIFHTSKMWKT